MILKKLIGLFCIFLIITLPFGYAQNDSKQNTPQDARRPSEASSRVGGAELNIGYIGPTTTEEFKNDTFFSDLVVNVNRYEPTVLTTNIIEEQNTPIYAFLSAFPSIMFGESPPRIESMNVAVIGGDTKYVAGTPQYTPPPLFTYEDLGYITTWIKKIPKESDVPKRIDLTLKARIRFRGETTAPVLGGEERRIFEESRSRKIFEEGAFIDPKFQIFGGRGYLRASFIGKDHAIFDIYGHDGVRIKPIRASVGQESESVTLVPGSKFVVDQVRIRVERIISETDRNANLEIEGKEQTYNIGNELKQSGWFIEDIFIPSENDKSASFVYLVRKDQISTIEKRARETLLIDNNDLILVFNEDESFNEDELKKWYHSLYSIEDNKRIIDKLRSIKKEDIEKSPLLKELNLFSPEAARFLLRKAPIIPKDEDHTKVIDLLIQDLKDSLDEDDNPENNFPTILEISKGEGIGAEFRIRGRTEIKQESDEFRGDIFNSCLDKNNKDIFCKLESIAQNNVVISYPRIDQEGKCIGGTRETLNLNEEFIQESQTRTTQREEGSKDIPPRVIINRRGDTLSAEKCGVPIELFNIETNRKVEVTILAGQRRGYTESIINLHIPIEKRAINISIDELEAKIEATKELIAELDNLIEKLEKFVSTWSKVCLGVSAWFTLEAFLIGLPKYKKTATPIDTSYTKEFDLEKEFYYSEPPKNNQIDETRRIHRIENGILYKRNKEGKEEVIGTPNIYQDVFYDKDGKQLTWDPIQKTPIQAPALTGSDERNAIRIYSGEGGKNKIVIGVDDKESVKRLIRQFGGRAIGQNTEEVLQYYSNKGYYFVYDQGESVQLFQKRGNGIDFLEIGEKNDLRIPLIFFKTGASAEERLIYDSFENGLSTVREAQIRGQKRVPFGGERYNLNNMGKLNQAKYRCEDILGSEAKCSILYNACDPVVCPRSRCNLGGQYNEIGPSGVIGSGIVGSLVLCLPNIHPDNGGVLVPICLSGLLAGLKGIRSHLQSYKECLEKQKAQGVVEGTCDKLRSIFICQLIWREALVLLQAKSGLINLFNGLGSGTGEEYFTKGIGGSIEEANEVVGFLVNDYASDVLAAYRGKGLAEIGVEVCKASIAQRIPFLDALVQEFATPANPPQFTAYFEEAPYAPTLGKSLYSVYYHIYAGTPQRQGQTLNYLIYLKSFGSSPRLIVDSGSLTGEQSADKNIDLIGDAGYQEICVNLNGLEQCGFGRVVSSSFLISGLDDYLAGIDLAREIKTAAQCKAEPTAPITYTVQSGTLPFARVRRVCSISNPGLGLGEENSWRRVGGCGFNEQGISLGLCWEFGDLSRYPETEKLALNLGCRNGDICEANQECTGKILREDSRGRVCCAPKGSCKEIEAFRSASDSIQDSGLSKIEISKLINDYNKNKITPQYRLSHEEAFALGAHACSKKELEDCQNFFEKIRPDHKLYAKAHFILGKIYYELKDFENAKEHLDDANKKKEQLSEDDKKTLDEILKTIEEELKKRKSDKDSLKTVDTSRRNIEKLINRATKLNKAYASFKTATQNINIVQDDLITIRNTIGSKSEKRDEIISNNLKDAIEKLTINITQDNEYTFVKQSMEAWKEALSREGRNIEETHRIVLARISNLTSRMSNWKDIREAQEVIKKLKEEIIPSLTQGLDARAITQIDETIDLLPNLQKPIDNLKEDIKKLEEQILPKNENNKPK